MHFRRSWRVLAILASILTRCITFGLYFIQFLDFYYNSDTGENFRIEQRIRNWKYPSAPHKVLSRLCKICTHYLMKLQSIRMTLLIMQSYYLKIIKGILQSKLLITAFMIFIKTLYPKDLIFQKLRESSVLLLETNKCPLCLQQRTNDTVCFVFFY